MKKRALIIAAAAVVLIITVLLIKSYSSSQPATITLPKPNSQSDPGIDSTGDSLLVVSPETVCLALSALNRMESYFRVYTVTTYWDGGECRDSLNVWQKGNSLRMSLDHAGTVKNLLIVGRDLYIWYDGYNGAESFTYYKDFDYAETDRFARLLTYEELYALDASAIAEAGYIQQQGEPCIFVKYEGANSYESRIYVSVNSGLLVTAEIFDGDTLIYSMQSQTTELSTPSDEIFLPPIG